MIVIVNVKAGFARSALCLKVALLAFGNIEAADFAVPLVGEIVLHALLACILA